MKKWILLVGLIFSIGSVQAYSLDSMSYRALDPVVSGKKITLTLSRIQSAELGVEHISFLYVDDHNFAMQLNGQDKILGKWHLAPNGKLCRYFNFARSSVVCEYWFDMNTEYLIVSTNGQLSGIVKKSDIKSIS